MTKKLEMYATSFCRHCMDARDFLASKDIEYDEYLLDLMPKEKDVMLERCGHCHKFLSIISILAV